ncbi:MAG TPA: hypothetical protein VN363_00120 [Anaerolineales bacterium]|nr:hypothetical protein [Anaerolineales bacterium]
MTSRKWFYPLVYFFLFLISALPPYTALPYDPRDTQGVIASILEVSIRPYQAWGWVFHVGTLAVILLIVILPKNSGRVVSAYFGLNYLVVAALQTHAVTEKYGFALQSGALVGFALLGALWLWVAWRGKLEASFRDVPAWRYLLLPLALLVFWAPLRVEGATFLPNFDPRLLLTSADYGLAYCFLTPVFLFLLILFYPRVDGFAFRVTAFNALLYGLFNLALWRSPDTLWMGVLHLPLLVMSVTALWMSHFGRVGEPKSAAVVRLSS